MKVSIYSVFDTKANAFLQPWFASNNAMAFRNCQKAAKNTQSPFNEFPADFVLTKIGEFDDETGVINAFPKYENLGNFVQFLPEQSSSATPDSVAA